MEKRIRNTAASLLFLSILVFEALILQKTTVSSLFSIRPVQLPSHLLPDPLVHPSTITIHEAFSAKMLNASHLAEEKPPLKLTTQFEENRNIKKYGLYTAKNVCLDGSGNIIMVGISQEELNKILDSDPDLLRIWNGSYNNTWAQSGFKFAADMPDNGIWIKGNSTHIIPYVGNVFHNFADTVWPHIARHEYPLNATTPTINLFVVHRLKTWLDQAYNNNERATFLFQIRLLGELSKEARFLATDGHGNQPFCFERLTLSCSACDRMSNFLGSDIVIPAILKYRAAALKFFNIPEAKISIPPKRLRITIYGRRDTKRRRIANSDDVVRHLKSSRYPVFKVNYVDELLAQGLFNQTVAETIALYSQTDILISVHGANTWAAMFLPEGAAVIEIYGPCGPGTWIRTIVTALGLKHDVESNPWKDIVPSEIAGNTSKCENAMRTPDFTLDVEKLDYAIRKLSLPAKPSDRLPLHWLYDQNTGSYV